MAEYFEERLCDLVRHFKHLCDVPCVCVWHQSHFLGSLWQVNESCPQHGCLPLSSVCLWLVYLGSWLSHTTTMMLVLLQTQTQGLACKLTIALS